MNPISDNCEPESISFTQFYYIAIKFFHVILIAPPYGILCDGLIDSEYSDILLTSEDAEFKLINGVKSTGVNVRLKSLYV